MLAEIERCAVRVVEPCSGREKRCTAGATMPCESHRPQQPAPQRKALIKGKWPPVKAVTSLDNGRKWRVYAGRTLELLR